MTYLRRSLPDLLFIYTLDRNFHLILNTKLDTFGRLVKNLHAQSHGKIDVLAFHFGFVSDTNNFKIFTIPDRNPGNHVLNKNTIKTPHSFNCVVFNPGCKLHGTIINCNIDSIVDIATKNSFGTLDFDLLALYFYLDTLRYLHRHFSYA